MIKTRRFENSFIKRRENNTDFFADTYKCYTIDHNTDVYCIMYVCVRARADQLDNEEYLLDAAVDFYSRRARVRSRPINISSSFRRV